MLKIPTPKPFATITTDSMVDVWAASKYSSDDVNTRIPTVVSERIEGKHCLEVVGANLYRVSPAAGRRMRAIAAAIGSAWVTGDEEARGGYEASLTEEDEWGYVRAQVNPVTGDALIKVFEARRGAPAIIIEAPSRGGVRVHISGYLAVWTPGGWDHAAKPEATGAWSGMGKTECAWAYAKSVLAALGAPANLPGSGPVLA